MNGESLRVDLSMMIRILRCNEVHKDPLFEILPDFFSLLAATTKKIGRFFVQIMELIFSLLILLDIPPFRLIPAAQFWVLLIFPSPILLLLLSLYHFIFTTIYGSEIRGLCLDEMAGQNTSKLAIFYTI